MGWIGVDLDGTLAMHSGGKVDAIGAPIPPMVRRVKGWLDEGKDVRILTARVGRGMSDVERKKAAADIRVWCRRFIGKELPVTACKDYAMEVLYDDRAVQVIHNTGELMLLPGSRRL